jgi:hypothetical protein
MILGTRGQHANHQTTKSANRCLNKHSAVNVDSVMKLLAVCWKISHVCGPALSLQVISWHLPYNLGKSMEKPQLG